METKNSDRKPSRLHRNLSLALSCCAGLSLTVGSAIAQQAMSLDEMPSSQYDDGYGQTSSIQSMSSSQISRPVDQLFTGQTVYSEEKGNLQLSLSGAHERDGSQRFNEVTARAEYGVTDRLQFQAELPYQVADRTGSFSADKNVGNVEVGALYSIMRGSAPISLSAAMDVQIPVGHQSAISDNRGSSETLLKPSIIAAKDFSGTQVHSSIQAELGGADRALNYNVGAVRQFGSWSPTVEMAAQTMDNRAPEFYATPGVYYNFSNRAELGVGAPIGLNAPAEDAQIMAKFNFRFR